MKLHLHDFLLFSFTIFVVMWAAAHLWYIWLYKSGRKFSPEEWMLKVRVRQMLVYIAYFVGVLSFLLLIGLLPKIHLISDNPDTVTIGSRAPFRHETFYVFNSYDSLKIYDARTYVYNTTDVDLMVIEAYYTRDFGSSSSGHLRKLSKVKDILPHSLGYIPHSIDKYFVNIPDYEYFGSNKANSKTYYCIDTQERGNNQLLNQPSPFSFPKLDFDNILSKPKPTAPINFDSLYNNKVRPFLNNDDSRGDAQELSPLKPANPPHKGYVDSLTKAHKSLFDSTSGSRPAFPVNPEADSLLIKAARARAAHEKAVSDSVVRPSPAIHPVINPSDSVVIKALNQLNNLDP